MRKCKKVDILDDFSKEVDDIRKALLSVFKKKNEEFFNAETLLIQNAVYCGSKTKGAFTICQQKPKIPVGNTDGTAHSTRKFSKNGGNPQMYSSFPVPTGMTRKLLYHL